MQVGGTNTEGKTAPAGTIVAVPRNSKVRTHEASTYPVILLLLMLLTPQHHRCFRPNPNLKNLTLMNILTPKKNSKETNKKDKESWMPSS